MPWTDTPPLAYLLAQTQLIREMERRGVELTREQAQALARASIGPPRRWLAREPELSQKGHQILDRIVAEREGWSPAPGPVHGTRSWPTPAPEPGLGDRSDISDILDGSGTGEGRGGTATRQHQRNRGRVEKNNPFAESADDEQFQDEDE